MSCRVDRRRTWRTRRLHVERLELRAAPGTLLAGAGLFGPGLADFARGQDVAAATTEPVASSSTKSSDGDDLNDRRAFRGNLRFEAIDLLQAADKPSSRVGASAPTMKRDVLTHASSSFDRPAAFSAFSAAFSALGDARTDDAPILKSSTLPDSKPAVQFGGGGGGGSSNVSAGGAAGSTGSRTGAAQPQDASTSTPNNFSSADPTPTLPAAPRLEQPGPPAPEASATTDTGWTVPTGIGQCRSPAGNPAASYDNTSADGLQLVDAAGNSLDIPIDANTLVIGAATWCGNTAKLKAQLATPEAQAALAGLRLVWAFGDEGGAGPGGVLNAEFLQGIPGEVAFLGEGSVAPERFPSAYNAASGQFDIHALDGIESWLTSGISRGALAPGSEVKLTDSAGAPVPIAHDANTLVIGAATWCPYCAALKDQLNLPELRTATAGLRIVFAFTNEGGDGPGGVLRPEYLDNLPGEAAFLTLDSVQPDAFPMAYNSLSGRFDANPMDSVMNWLANNYADRISRGALAPGSEPAQIQPGASAPRLMNGTANGAIVLAGDYDGNNRVDAADYVVWRESVGLTGPMLAADGDGNEIVDDLDYDIWKANYGNFISVPGAFSITGPAGTQTQDAVTLSWSASESATSYQLVLSKHADLSFPLLVETLAATSRNVSLNDGTYYLGVTAINDDGSTAAQNQGFSFQVQLPPVDQLIFVTSLRYFVSPTFQFPPAASLFHGSSAADYHCTNLANSAGLLDEPWDFNTVHFRAVLAEVSIGVVDRTGLVNDEYYNTAGDLVATNRADLMAGNFSAPILTQGGSAVTSLPAVWTGANFDGTASANKCSNWTSTSGVGSIGVVPGGGVTGNWLGHTTINCTSQARFYCVGKKPTP